MGLNGSVRIGRITRMQMEQDVRKISEIRTEQKQTTRKTTEKPRRQVSRDSVTLRENPCSNKNIRSISGIRTEQKTNTEIHGTTRR